MRHIKHLELSEKYRVSLKTVHNWIDSAKQGKLKLKLQDYNGRLYIADTQSNHVILSNLAENGKKYRNTIHHKIVQPTDKFYELYNRKQILDIITNLRIQHEIPRQYNYFGQGAANWVHFTDNMDREVVPNILNQSIRLLEASRTKIDELIENFDKINVIDIGPGDARPVRGFLEYMRSKGILNRYIAIDVSQTMLDTAEKNIKEWFGDTISYEGHLRDITYQRFNDIVVDDMLDSNAEKTINIVLFLGGTSMNFYSPRDAYKVIYSSLSANDITIFTLKVDCNSEMEWHNFAVNADASAKALSTRYSYIFDLLNINESYYDVEMGFDDKNRTKYIRIRLKVGLTICFSVDGAEHRVVFEKGETVVLWRAMYQTSLELLQDFKETGFTMLQASVTKDRQYFLSISGVDANHKVNLQ